MKKGFGKLFVFILVVFVMIPMNKVFANSTINLVIEGHMIKLDQTPVIENGRVLVPLRGIFEELGAEIEWDGSTNTIEGKKENTSVKLKIGSKMAYVNSKEIKLEVPGKLIKGRTMVPVRFIAESLGVKVNWDVDNQRVIVGKDLESLEEQAVYENMMTLKKQYPEGMPWTNDDYYSPNGGGMGRGYGCVGFAFILSDEAFGSLNARRHNDFSNLRVGDVVRINNNTHSVIIISIEGEKITIAEGNYNASIHWGRIFSFEEIKNISDYILTRYPRVEF